MYSFVMLSLPCIYCFSPLFLSIVDRPLPMLPPLFDYFLVDRVPLLPSFQASSATSPLPHIAYCLYLFCCTRHCCCYVTFLFNCIACHCRPLLYFLYSYAAG